jgi:hypothetical protein
MAQIPYGGISALSHSMLDRACGVAYARTARRREDRIGEASVRDTPVA